MTSPSPATHASTLPPSARLQPAERWALLFVLGAFLAIGVTVVRIGSSWRNLGAGAAALLVLILILTGFSTVVARFQGRPPLEPQEAPAPLPSLSLVLIGVFVALPLAGAVASVVFELVAVGHVPSLFTAERGATQAFFYGAVWALFGAVGRWRR